MRSVLFSSFVYSLRCVFVYSWDRLSAGDGSVSGRNCGALSSAGGRENLILEHLADSLVNVTGLVRVSSELTTSVKRCGIPGYSTLLWPATVS